MSIFYNEFYKKRRGKHLDDFSFKWPVLRKVLPLKDGQEVLDFGCGTGKITREIEKDFPKCKFSGVDVSNIAINIAKKRFPNHKFFTIEDGYRLPFKNDTFDFIIALDVVEHVYNTEKTFSELTRVLKHRGKILISTPYYGFIKNLLIITFGFDQVFNPMGQHIRFFSNKSLFSIVKSHGLKIISHGYYGRFYPISRGIYIVAEKVNSRK